LWEAIYKLASTHSIIAIWFNSMHTSLIGVGIFELCLKICPLVQTINNTVIWPSLVPDPLRKSLRSKCDVGFMVYPLFSHVVVVIFVRSNVPL